MTPSRRRGGRRLRPRRPALSPERAADATAAREAALKVLERMRRTRAQLVGKLLERGYEPQVVKAVVARLVEVGLVDDFEYAAAFLRQRLAGRSASWRRLEQELRRRGVPADAVERARARVIEEEGLGGDEAEAARRVLAQVGRRYRGLDPAVRRRRLMALLARRGFDYDTIAEALKEEE